MMPPLAAVAAMERASMSATSESCPCPGFDPSRLGKLRVVWRMLRPLFDGTSPAPKHGPQNAGFITTPASMRSAVMPSRVTAIDTGVDCG